MRLKIQFFGGRGSSSGRNRQNASGGNSSFTQKDLEKGWKLQKEMIDEEHEGFASEKRYELAKMFTTEKANKDNFFENSIGYWELKKRRPNGEPDHVSRNVNWKKGIVKTSSKYWYTDKGVYRQSDHWGADVASCSWYIKGRKYNHYGVKKGKTETAFISWEDLKAKGLVVNAGDKYELSGFTFEK